jgi:hypothetical protein
LVFLDFVFIFDNIQERNNWYKGKNGCVSGLYIIQNGVGIFKKIQNALGLEDERHAVLELSRGKLTADPARHTGEGIFFVADAR